MKTLSDYQALVTSEHNDKPLFMQVIETLVQPSIDQQTVLESMPGLYDLDVAVGVQLDAVGAWIGQNRSVGNLGSLDDDQYRTLLRAKIANNYWDGTIPGAYAIWDVMFQGAVELYIFDNQDMSMTIGFGGGPFDPVTEALMTGGYLSLKPNGVRIAGYIVLDGPLFGFDLDTATVAGFDTGVFAPV